MCQSSRPLGLAISRPSKAETYLPRWSNSWNMITEWTRSGQSGLYYIVSNVLEKRSGSKLQCLGDRFSCDAAVPLLNHSLPGHTASDLLQHVGDEDARAVEGGFAVTDTGIRYDMPADQLSCHLVPPAKEECSTCRHVRRDQSVLWTM